MRLIKGTLKRLSDRFSFTEGPAADSAGNVYFSDQPEDLIYRWDWKSGIIEVVTDKSGRANGLCFNPHGELLCCADESGEIRKVLPDGNMEVLVAGPAGKRFNGPNDLWADGSGGVYFTDPFYDRTYWNCDADFVPERNLYYLDKNGKLCTLEAFQQPNGITGSAILKKLFVSDIDAGQTWVYDIAGVGHLAKKKLFCTFGSDGMTLDREENLYLTGDGVTIFNKRGEKIETIAVPEDWTGNLTFGGPDFSTIFITASRSVFTLEMNVRGMQQR